MRYAPLSLALYVLIEMFVVAQDELKLGVPPPAPSLQTYLIHITECKLKATDAQTTSKMIAETFEQLKKDGKLDLIESITMNAIERRTAHASVHTTFNAINGSASAGTTVSLTATSQGEKVIVEFQYDKSRFVDKGSESVMPNTTIMRVTTSLVLLPGKPTFVYGTASEPTSYLIVSVEK